MNFWLCAEITFSHFKSNGHNCRLWGRPDLEINPTQRPTGHRAKPNLETNWTQGPTEIRDPLDSEIYRTWGQTKLKDQEKLGTDQMWGLTGRPDWPDLGTNRIWEKTGLGAQTDMEPRPDLRTDRTQEPTRQTGQGYQLVIDL